MSGLKNKSPLPRVVQEMSQHGMEAFGKWYSLYRAFVVDREDPSNISRLKLIIPDVSGMEAYDYWAFPRNVFSGKDYGAQVIPQKGDVVWVEFEGGNPEIPVYSLGHHIQKEVPRKRKDFKDPDSYWFQTPKGNFVIINDTKNYIHVETAQGDYVEVNDKAISLVSDKKISLGKLNKSEQPAVLGDDLVEVLKDMQKFMQDFSVALSTDITSSAGAPFLKYTKMAAKMPTLLPLAVKVKAKISKILSTKVSLDK